MLLIYNRDGKGGKRRGGRGTRSGRGRVRKGEMGDWERG